MNWKLLARLALLVAIVGGALVFRPAAICVKNVTSGTSIGIAGEHSSARFGSDERSEAARADLDRLFTGTGFIGRFFGSVPACLAASPPTAAPVWALGAFGGGLLGFALFSALGRYAYRRQVRRASQRGAGGGRTTTSTAVVGRPAKTDGPARRADDSGAYRPPQRTAELSGARTAVGATGAAPVVDALDILNALDHEAAQGEWRRDEVSTAGASARQQVSLPGGSAAVPGPAPVYGTGTVGALEAPGASRRAPSAFEAGLDVEQAPAFQPAGTPGPPVQEPAAATPWDDWSEDSDLRALLDNADPTAAPALGSIFAGGGDIAISLLHLPARWLLGEDLSIALALTRSGDGVLDRVLVRLSLVDERASVVDLWPTAVPLRDLLDVATIAATGRGVFVVPWPAISAGLTGREDRLRGECTIRVACEIDAIESVASTPVVDTITAVFVDRNGQPVRPSVVRMTTTGGRIIRAGVGARSAGMFDPGWIAPGRYTIEMEDGTEMLTRGGATSVRVALETDGIARLSGQLPQGAVRRVPVLTARIVHVDGTHEGPGDGSHGAPFRTLSQALAQASLRGPDPEPLEIRVRPCTSRAAEREGLLAGVDGQNWLAWWEGRSYNTARAWTTGLEPAAHRFQVRVLGPALAEDLLLSGMKRVRVVNAAYADLREQAVRDTRLLAHLDEAYAGEPMAVLLPGPEPREPYRVELQQCSDIRFEGIRFVGCAGQSGVSIVDSHAVQIVRCWIEAFEAGPSGRPGVHAVGRGMQIGNSGTDEHPIELRWCEIGWNRCTRPSVPVRGAAMSVYESRVRLSRCYLHDNRAGQAPADVLADGQSRLFGDATNHRAGNLVES